MTTETLRDALSFIVTNERMSTLHGRTVVFASDIDAIIAAAHQEATATLRAERDEARVESATWHAEMVALVAIVDVLTADNERLRGLALDAILRHHALLDRNRDWSGCPHCYRLLDAAIATPTSEPEGDK